MTSTVRCGARGDQLDERGSRLAHVLGVVEHEQQLAWTKNLREGIERLLRVGDPERLGDRGDDELGVAERRQLDQYRAVRVRRGGATRCFEGEPRLAAPAGSGEDEHARFPPGEDLAKLCKLARPADEATERRRKLAGHARCRRRGFEIGIMPQDPLLELAQPSAGLEPELLVEPTPIIAVVVQRLRLAAGPVQRQHRQAL